MARTVFIGIDVSKETLDISIDNKHQRIAPNRRNLSNQEETPQFKFLVVFKYSCIGSASAVITEIFTGAISARRLAWFWEERSNH